MFAGPSTDRQKNALTVAMLGEITRAIEAAGSDDTATKNGRVIREAMSL